MGKHIAGGIVFHKHNLVILFVSVLNVLSCQPRVTVASCFVYKVIWDLESIDHLCINPNTRVIYRFTLAEVECTSSCVS